GDVRSATSRVTNFWPSCSTHSAMTTQPPRVTPLRGTTVPSAPPIACCSGEPMALTLPARTGTGEGGATTAARIARAIPPELLRLSLLASGPTGVRHQVAERLHEIRRRDRVVFHDP